MTTTITPSMHVTTLLGPNYLDCQHELTLEEFQGVKEVQATLSFGKLIVDLRGVRPDPTDKNPNRLERRSVTFGIRLISKSNGLWKRETPLPLTPTQPN